MGVGTVRPGGLVRIGARVLLVVVVVAIAWGSLAPPADLPPTGGLSDKALHALGYALLGALAVAGGLRLPYAVGGALVLGLALECVQGLLGYRSFEWADLVADVAGATAGALVVVLTGRLLSRGPRRRASR